MKIIEWALLAPHTMGAAKIDWKARNDNSAFSRGVLAERQGSVITLTNTLNQKVYMLKEGQQFLYTGNTYEGERKLYFGGMDESPFLVELQIAALEGLIGGEEAFFNGLKPPVVRSWEQEFNVLAKRQGDFFAIGPKKLVRWPDFFRKYASKTKFETSVVENMQLFGTRHRFSGFIAQNGTNLIGEGTIEAPDHAPLEIKGPHLISQSMFLVTPRQAD